MLELILKNERLGRRSRYGDMNVMMMSKGEERTAAKWRNWMSNIDGMSEPYTLFGTHGYMPSS